MSIIGDNIRQARIDAQLTQEELAKRMGYKSKSTINKIELGKNDIPQSKIKQFADVLGTTTAVLMGWKDTNQSNFMTEQLLGYFNDLNETGKSEAIKRIGELTLVESYQSEECKIKIEHMKEAKRTKKLFNIDI